MPFRTAFSCTNILLSEVDQPLAFPKASSKSLCWSLALQSLLMLLAGRENAMHVEKPLTSNRASAGMIREDYVDSAYRMCRIVTHLFEQRHSWRLLVAGPPQYVKSDHYFFLFATFPEASQSCFVNRKFSAACVKPMCSCSSNALACARRRASV